MFPLTFLTLFTSTSLTSFLAADLASPLAALAFFHGSALSPYRVTRYVEKQLRHIVWIWTTHESIEISTSPFKMSGLLPQSGHLGICFST